MSEKRNRLVPYRFAHAQMRLKHRYGVEMTEAEFLGLSELFERNRVTGARRDLQGNIEGWIRFHGQWVCASYRPGERLITTFMPCPPKAVLDEWSDEERRAQEQKRSQEMHATIQRKVAEQVNARTPKALWYRQKIESALKALSHGEMRSAIATLEWALKPGSQEQEDAARRADDGRAA